jgi:hypothetical protein
MIKTQLIAAYIFLANLFLPCSRDKKHNDFELKGRREYKILRAGKLAAEINECSGTIVSSAGNTAALFHINDSGGKPVIYQTDLLGAMENCIPVPYADNRDWEDITRDDNGNFYIGDFGNNGNRRKDLRIYKYNTEQKSTTIIEFSYPDQHGFPPVKDSLNFDCEALFWYKNHLYLFSKNRGDKYVKLYRLKEEGGTQVAELTDKTYLSGMITGAAVSPDGKTFALISYGKLYMFGIGEKGIDFRKPLWCKAFRRSGQAESITYLNPEELLIANEGGKIFRARKR